MVARGIWWFEFSSTEGTFLDSESKTQEEQNTVWNRYKALPSPMLISYTNPNAILNRRNDSPSITCQEKTCEKSKFFCLIYISNTSLIQESSKSQA